MEKIIIDRMDAEEFYRMLMDDAKSASDSKRQNWRTAQLLENITNLFNDLCGGEAVTGDWKK